ncbi:MULTISPECIES: hypothetical protein [Streptomyces]|uniref:Uncharacterized protein n=3 Tax=Streptomyces TaxID=1883 RepID=D9WPJ2_9ACTN|nr:MULTISPECIES: hypothetical protein [Streptomyces]EFL21857.1 hypothetical protein SSOG_01569 [Streptomyces himastatinicus ATCC 53653]QLH19269.1 hypothetical protein HYQ63_34890 [Streptomyces sp. Rer75]RNG12704.1 hypothetical protein EEJ42_32030 [Streptomyces botrytidirepellens]
MISGEMLQSPGEQSPIEGPPVPPSDEPRGCLFALSQPPLMLFLAFIGMLLFGTALHDLYRW